MRAGFKKGDRAKFLQMVAEGLHPDDMSQRLRVEPSVIARAIGSLKDKPSLAKKPAKKSTQAKMPVDFLGE